MSEITNTKRGWKMVLHVQDADGEWNQEQLISEGVAEISGDDVKMSPMQRTQMGTRWIDGKMLPKRFEVQAVDMGWYLRTYCYLDMRKIVADLMQTEISEGATA